MKKTLYYKKIAFLLIIILSIPVAGRSKSVDNCESSVNLMLNQGVIGLKNIEHVKNLCYSSIIKTGNYKELYAYYRLYKYVDDINNDKGSDDVYHWMIYYANQNSREFDERLQEFKNKQGIYENELKDFEKQLTQEEKIKAFSYIADNLATEKNIDLVKKNDYRKSFEYLKRAADAGDDNAQGEVGVAYFKGSDWMNKFEIPADYVVGYKWIYLSTLHSEQKSYYRDLSLKAFDILVKKMTAQQIQQGKEEANIWLRKNREFIKNHPLKIISMTEEEIKIEKEKTEKFVKENNLDKPLQTNN